MTTPATPNNPKEEPPKARMSKIARGEDASKAEPPPNPENDNLPAPRTPQNIIQTSEQAWIEGTQGLQRNLVRALQEYQTGWSGWKEKGLLAQKRQEMIKEVTEHYVRFLREEARITSDAAFEARRAVLVKQLLELKSGIYKELADIAGLSSREIEQIFQAHHSQLTDELIRQKYAQFVVDRLVELFDTANLK